MVGEGVKYPEKMPDFPYDVSLAIIRLKEAPTRSEINTFEIDQTECRIKIRVSN